MGQDRMCVGRIIMVDLHNVQIQMKEGGRWGCAVLYVE